MNQIEGVNHVIAECLESIFIDTENIGIFSSQERARNVLYQKSEDYSNNQKLTEIHSKVR